MAAESRQPRAMRLLRCAELALLLLLLAPGRSTEEEGGAEGEGDEGGEEGGKEGGAEEVAPQSSESRYDLQ